MAASSGVRRVAMSKKAGEGMPKKAVAVVVKPSKGGTARGNGAAAKGTHTRNIE